MSEPDRRRCRLLAWALAVGGLLLGVLGLAAGSGGWSALGDAGGAEWRVIVWTASSLIRSKSCGARRT